jgi:hypothetical protein
LKYNTTPKLSIPIACQLSGLLPTEALKLAVFWLGLE